MNPYSNAMVAGGSKGHDTFIFLVLFSPFSTFLLPHPPPHWPSSFCVAKQGTHSKGQGIVTSIFHVLGPHKVMCA